LLAMDVGRQSGSRNSIINRNEMKRETWNTIRPQQRLDMNLE
jgi:hypothetical protein